MPSRLVVRGSMPFGAVAYRDVGQQIDLHSGAVMWAKVHHPLRRCDIPLNLRERIVALAPQPAKPFAAQGASQ